MSGLKGGDPVRNSFVREFGEDQAQAIEDAGKLHWKAGEVFEDGWFPSPDTQTFQFWFLVVVGWECATTFRENHGITVSVEDLKLWAQLEGEFGVYDGEIPDFLSTMEGTYADWFGGDL